MRLAELTWHQVKEYLGKRTSLILPLGSCEQHGRWLPLSTDMIVAEKLADRVSQETGVALAPQVVYGVNLPCDRFMYGTAGLTLDTLRSVVRDLTDDWSRQGFRRFYLMTAHGCTMGNFGFAHHQALKEAARPLLTQGDSEVYLIFPYWLDISDLLEKQVNAQHAGEVETSLIMYLTPDLVKADRIKDAPEAHEEVSFEVFPEGVQRDFPPSDFSGGEGSPSFASPEKGQKIFNRFVEQIVAFVKEKEGA